MLESSILRSLPEKQNLPSDKIPTSLVCTLTCERAQRRSRWRFSDSFCLLSDVGSKAKTESEAVEKELEL